MNFAVRDVTRALLKSLVALTLIVTRSMSIYALITSIPTSTPTFFVSRQDLDCCATGTIVITLHDGAVFDGLTSVHL